MIKINELNINADLKILKEFCNNCKLEGLKNNSSLQALKIDQLDKLKGKYWLLKDNNKIVGISGAHFFPEIDNKTYRVQFRTAILKKYQGFGSFGIKKNLTNCLAWKLLLPLQIKWAKNKGGTRFIITTNTPQNKNDQSGKMFKVDKIFHLLEKQQIVKKINTLEIYYTWQNIWEINLDKI